MIASRVSQESQVRDEMQNQESKSRRERMLNGVRSREEVVFTRRYARP